MCVYYVSKFVVSRGRETNASGNSLRILEAVVSPKVNCTAESERAGEQERKREREREREVPCSRRVSFMRRDMHTGSFTLGAAIGITAKSRLGAASRLL